MGRPVIPTEIKRLKGTLRADRLPPNAPLERLCEPLQAPIEPLGLSEQGLAFWGAVWGCNWISQKSDYQLVLLTAEAISEREQLRELVASIPENTKARSALRELDRQIVSQLALLGLSPSDRARLGIAEVKKESKLEELLRRKAERQNELSNQRAESANQGFINT
jgi:hypothetical protein